MVCPNLFPVKFNPKAAPTSLLGTALDNSARSAGQVIDKSPKANEFNTSNTRQSPTKCHDASKKGIDTISDKRVRFLPNLSARAPLGARAPVLVIV